MTGRPLVLPLSARSSDALQAMARQYLAANLSRHDAIDVVAWMSQRQTMHKGQRLALVASSGAQLTALIDKFLAGAADPAIIHGRPAQTQPTIAFICAGQVKRAAGSS